MAKIFNRVGNKLSTALRGKAKFAKSKKTIATYDLRREFEEKRPLPRSPHFKESWERERKTLFFK